jgi:proteic killer suppression protein
LSLQKIFEEIMIKSFKHKGLEDFFRTGNKAGIQPTHEKRLRLQLTALNQATGTNDLPPAWRLHPLHGDMAGHYAITVNGNWRITFSFDVDNDIVLVDYKDYH